MYAVLFSYLRWWPKPWKISIWFGEWNPRRHKNIDNLEKVVNYYLGMCLYDFWTFYASRLQYLHHSYQYSIKLLTNKIVGNLSHSRRFSFFTGRNIFFLNINITILNNNLNKHENKDIKAIWTVRITLIMEFIFIILCSWNSISTLKSPFSTWIFYTIRRHLIITKTKEK